MDCGQHHFLIVIVRYLAAYVKRKQAILDAANLIYATIKSNPNTHHIKTRFSHRISSTLSSLVTRKHPLRVEFLKEFHALLSNMHSLDLDIQLHVIHLQNALDVVNNAIDETGDFHDAETCTTANTHTGRSLQTDD
jgi:hypothetical protein